MAGHSEIRIPHQYVANSLFSYLLLVDTRVDPSSSTDSKLEVYDIEDGEHKYDQVRNNDWLKVHMEQVENNSQREDHTCHYYQKLWDENNHMQYSTNIAGIQTCYHIFQRHFDLSRNRIIDGYAEQNEKQTCETKIEDLSMLEVFKD
jgi:hypothetical protein